MVTLGNMAFEHGLVRTKDSAAVSLSRRSSGNPADVGISGPNLVAAEGRVAVAACCAVMLAMQRSRRLYCSGNTQ